MTITKDIYTKSITSRCWAFTQYDEGWENCQTLREDAEIAELIQQEQMLEPLPQWVIDLVEKINYPPFCPHASFPLPYLKMIDAIGNMIVPTFNYGCYTVDRSRKDRMTDYIFCVDAWRAGADFHQAAVEISKRGASLVDWFEVCEKLWEVLGDHTELKLLLIDRILHRERWWVKTLIWDDDPGEIHLRDQYLGEIKFDPDFQGDYGNPGFKDPYGAELMVPEIMALENKLSKVCQDWSVFKVAIHSTWLCGPKAFRYLEKLLWCVGKEKMVINLPSSPVENNESVPDFLQCADTYPDTEKAKQWMCSFFQSMETWLNGESAQDDIAHDIYKRLGERNDLKVWLCGLYDKKLRMLAPFGCKGE